MQSVRSAVLGIFASMGGWRSKHWQKSLDFGKGFVIQFVSYLNLTINFRAIAHEQYVVAFFTALFAGLLAYAIVRMISHDDRHRILPGLVIGGAFADVIGIWLTRSWS